MSVYQGRISPPGDRKISRCTGRKIKITLHKNWFEKSSGANFNTTGATFDPNGANFDFTGANFNQTGANFGPTSANFDPTGANFNRTPLISTKRRKCLTDLRHFRRRF